ncbi:golgin subfamily A member 6-like protein 26 [Mercenaria mercenaria]|uniref:golgin subfamily A member 6-like protein 26 n=1 Tax=Mercenaria mercenaria TaxID=6596 RepID=UPI00234ED14E|nr:golgin subfamily A member 6-like protein 26 [Mercenaria mercenaria]
MARTSRFQSMDLWRIGPVGREDHCKEGYLFRSYKNLYHNGANASIELKFTQVPPQPFQLRKFLEQQEANANDYLKYTNTIRSQEKKENQNLKRTIMSLEGRMKCLEEVFGYRNDALIEKNERLVRELHGQNDRLYHMERQLHQTEHKWRQSEAEKNVCMTLQDKQIHYQEWEFKTLLEIMRSTEINKRNEDYEDTWLRYKYNGFSSEKERMQHCMTQWSDKGTAFNKGIALLKAEIECLDKKIKELEKISESKEIEINKKQEAEEKMDKAVRSLKEKNHLHQAEVERCYEKIKHLEEMLVSKRTATNDGNERQAHRVMKQKDEEILDLRHQLKQTLMTLERKESEINATIALLKKKTQDLENEVEHRDMTIKDLGYKKKESCDRNELLENKVKEKDCQLYKERDQRQHAFKNMQEKEAEMEEIIASLKGKVKLLEKDIEHRDLNIKHLEEMLVGKRTATNDGNERQAHRVKKQKDEEILDLRDQLKKTLMTLERKESEMNKIIASLKKQTQDLENDIKHRDMTNQHLQAEVERCNEKVKNLEEMLDSKRTATNDGDKRQSNTVMRQKDDQISDLRHQLKQTLDRKESEMNEIIASLKKKTQDLKNEVEHRDMTIKDLGYKKKETCDKNELLEKKVKEKDCQLYKERDQRQRAFEKMQEKESEMEGIIASLKTKGKLLEEDIEHRNLKIKHLEEGLNSKTIGVPVTKEPNRDVMEMESKVIELTDQLDQSLTKLQETKIELDETKTRLSKAMGNMLTDNNPNIADLSDKNRPTKLSERYAELYDNQWTDAFDILEKRFHTEENAIAALLHMLKDAMTFCRNKAHEQMEELRRVLALSNDKEDGGISADLGKLVKDCRKATASMAVGNLHKMYMSHARQSTDETIKTAQQVSSFTKECLEVCWFMAIQDPPVVFAPELRQGSKFNTDLFKPYTSSGTHVDYVVWPALLLHEGGPVLAKGVAQGKGKKST